MQGSPNQKGGCAGDSATRANEPQANTPLDHEKSSPSGVKGRQGHAEFKVEDVSHVQCVESSLKLA